MLPLIAGLAIYIYLVGQRVATRVRNVDKKPIRWTTDIALFLSGVVALYAGGELVLRSAVGVAQLLQISPTLIGLTIVAAGTSVPDTIASLVAVRRNESEIAVGNLLGSNISNIFVVLTGSMLANRVSGQAGELTASKIIVGDYAMVALVSILILTFSIFAGRIGRKSSFALFALYASYMCFRIGLELFGGASG